MSGYTPPELAPACSQVWDEAVRWARAALPRWAKLSAPELLRHVRLTCQIDRECARNVVAHGEGRVWRWRPDESCWLVIGGHDERI